LRAYDDRGGYTAQLWTVNVAQANRPPVLAPVPDRTVREGDLVEVPFAATDPDGNALVFGVNNLPPGAFYDAHDNVLRWQPGAQAAGRYANIEVFVTDGVNRVSRTFQIIVANVNQAPVLNPPVAQTIRDGDPLVVQLHATDPDGDKLAFSATGLPVGALLHPDTGVLTWTPRFDQHGTYAITVTASDGELSQSRRLNVTVTNLNGQVQ